MGSASRANKRGKDRPKKAQVKKSVPSKLSLAPAKITQPRLIENIYSRKRLFSVLDNALKKACYLDNSARRRRKDHPDHKLS